MVGFCDRIRESISGPLRAGPVEVLQVNLGYKCNLSCKHCHLGGGPGREEAMGAGTAEAVLRAMARCNIGVLDLTGGAPELNPSFRRLVEGASELGARVLVRSNLTVFLEPGCGWLPGFLAEHGVEIIASLPYYLEAEVDRVRGDGTFSRSIEAMGILNSLGYGGGEAGGKVLNLVYNPMGAYLSPPQAELEKHYREEFGGRFGISFNRLLAFSNMPLGRFGAFLRRTGTFDNYIRQLHDAFNPSTLEGLMCRSMVSVGWNGRLYDCDFNQALGIGISEGAPENIFDFNARALSGRAIAVDQHCYGCTAGQGST